MKHPKGLIIQTESRLLYIELRYVSIKQDRIEKDLKDVFVCWTYD